MVVNLSNFQFQDDCDAIKVPSVLSDAAKGIFETIQDGAGFLNPLGDMLDGPLGAISSLTAGGGGVIDKLNGLIEEAAGDTGLTATLEGLQGQLIGVGGEGGILSQLNEFKAHTDILAGVGDMSDFAEVVGMAIGADNINQLMGGGQGAFDNMFGSLIQGQSLMSDAMTAIGAIEEVLDGGLEGLADPDVLLNLVGGADGGGMIQTLTGLGDSLLNQVSLDTGFLDSAKQKVMAYGISQMISTSNCYVQDLVGKMIGSDELMENLPTAIEEKVGPTLTDEEKEKIEQERKAKVEEAKSKGVKSEKIAELSGGTDAEKKEVKEKAKEKPKYEITPIIRSTMTATIDESTTPMERALVDVSATVFSPDSPIWDTKVMGDGIEDGAWVLWYASGLYKSPQISAGSLRGWSDWNTIPVPDDASSSALLGMNTGHYGMTKAGGNLGDVKHPWVITIRAMKWNDSRKWWQPIKIKSDMDTFTTAQYFGRTSITKHKYPSSPNWKYGDAINIGRNEQGQNFILVENPI